MQIGIFDSGIGGITVLHDSLKMLPYEDYIYYADTLHVPYGSKSKIEVKKYVLEAAEFIMQQGIKALVVACNTATSVAIEDLRLKYRIPIIGMEPAIKPAVATNKNSNKRVLVTATALTLKEEKLKKLIAKLDKEHRVDLLPLPELVRFSESYEFNELAILPYWHEQLSRYELKKYETIVLGCTHFSFYKDTFRKIAPISVDIIDGTLGTFKNLKRTLVKMKAINEGNGEITYFNSGSEVIDSESLLKYSKLLHRLDEVESYYPLPGAFN